MTELLCSPEPMLTNNEVNSVNDTYKIELHSLEPVLMNNEVGTIHDKVEPIHSPEPVLMNNQCNA